MNNKDRSPYRRRIDTEDRLDHYRQVGITSRLPRLTILCEGLWRLDAECTEDTAMEVKENLRVLFQGFPSIR